MWGSVCSTGRLTEDNQNTSEFSDVWILYIRGKCVILVFSEPPRIVWLITFYWRNLVAKLFFFCFFTFMWQCIATNFFVIKPNRCNNFTNLFCHETLHVSDSSSFHHQDLFTVHSAMVYVIQDCRHMSYKPVWHTPLLVVQWINSWWRTDEQSETSRVSWQHKFVKLVHLVGFITK